MTNKIYKSIKELNPRIQPLVREFLKKAKVGKWQMFLVETYRTQARQKELYKAGKTPTPVATYHNWRLAFDTAFKDSKGNVSWDYKLFDKVAPIAEKTGFTWGGRWKNKDRVHFQWDKPWPKSKSALKPKPTPKPVPAPKTPATPPSAPQLESSNLSGGGDVVMSNLLDSSLGKGLVTLLRNAALAAAGLIVVGLIELVGGLQLDPSIKLMIVASLKVVDELLHKTGVAEKGLTRF